MAAEGGHRAQPMTDSPSAYERRMDIDLINDIADAFTNLWPVYIYNLTQGVVRYDTHVSPRPSDGPGFI